MCTLSTLRHLDIAPLLSTVVRLSCVSDTHQDHYRVRDSLDCESGLLRRRLEVAEVGDAAERLGNLPEEVRDGRGARGVGSY